MTYKFNPGDVVELASETYGPYGTANELTLGKSYTVQPKPSYQMSDDLTYLINDTGELEGYITRRFKYANPNVKNGTEIFTGITTDSISNGGGLKYDGGKLLFRALTRGLALPLRAVAAVLTYGAAKYKIDSWQTVPNGADRYEDALDRHLNSWKEGERFDEESGLHHLAHAACNVLFLLWYEMTANPLIDYTKFKNPNGNK